VTSAPAARRILALSLAAIVVLGAPAFLAGFLNDMDHYTLTADKLLRGGALYRDTIDTKPPLIFFHYALVFRVFGQNNVVAVKCVTLVVLALTALLVASIRRALAPAAPRPEVAALVYVLASFSGLAEDFLSSNSEIQANLPIVAGVACMVRAGLAYRPRRLVLAGALIGVAFLYRYQSGAALAAYAVTALAYRRELGHLGGRLACVALGFLVPVAAIVGYFAAMGALGDLAFLIRFQGYYLRAHETYWPEALAQVGSVVAGLGPVLVLGAGHAVALVRRRPTPGQAFLVAWLAVSLATCFLGGRYFAHYAIEAILPVALLVADRLASPPHTAHERRALAILAAVAVAFCGINATTLAARRDDRPPADVVRFVRAHTTRDEAILMWTPRKDVLLAADRVYATRFLFNDLLVGRVFGTRHRLASATAESARAAAVPELWPVFLRELDSARPRLVVDDVPARSRFTLDRYPALRAYVDRDYEPCVTVADYCIYVRK
jgi:hypothetical protein